METRMWLSLPRNTQNGESLLSKETAERSSNLKSSELGITLIFISGQITLPTKVRLVKAMFFQWSCMDVRVGLWRRLSAEELILLNCGVGEDSWDSLGLQGDPTSPFWRRSTLGFLWKEWCQSTGVSALASFLPKKSQGWSSELTGWISLQSKRVSRVFSNTTVQKHQFFGAQLSSQSNSHIHTWLLEKT